MPESIITDLAVPLFAAASGSASSVAVSQIGFGDAGGVAYAPSSAQMGLVNERLRIPIETRRQIAPQRWRVMAEVAAGVPSFQMREIGFFDADGNMIGVWAGLDVSPRVIGLTIYRVFYNLDLSAAPEGSVVVEADDDALYRHVLSDLTGHAIFADEQIKQRLLIRDQSKLFTDLAARVAALEA